MSVRPRYISPEMESFQSRVKSCSPGMESRGQVLRVHQSGWITCWTEFEKEDTSISTSSGSDPADGAEVLADGTLGLSELLWDGLHGESHQIGADVTPGRECDT